MNPRTERLLKRFYSHRQHPYKIYRNVVRKYANKDDIIVDAGCGREALDLRDFADLSNNLLGLDIQISPTSNSPRGLSLITNDISNICIKDNIVKLVVSKSTLEHLTDPLPVFTEVYRILEYGGYFIFLTPNEKDYASIIAKLIPNHFHALVVNITEGRKIEDTFPTYFKCNNYRLIKILAGSVGFHIERFEYLGQYPAYLTFSPTLFLLGTIYDTLTCRYESLRFLRPWILAVLKK